jgi:hypothetical protein
MIKCPKEFWKIMQENKEWDNIIKELEKCGLSVEVEQNNALVFACSIWDKLPYQVPNCIQNEYKIQIFSPRYKSMWVNATYYNMHDSKKAYEDELRRIREEMQDISRLKVERKSRHYQTREENEKNKEKIQEYFFRISSLEESVRKYEDFLDKKYEGFVATNSEFQINVIRGIEEKIKEYQSVKFGTADIVLY